jgi:hypothetical protein
MAQGQVSTWTPQDRQYLLDNLVRSRDAFYQEIQHLGPEQMRFHEQADRWSINEVLEHICPWEMLFAYEIHNGLQAGKQPDRIGKGLSDKEFEVNILEGTPHQALDYTRPYSYTMPRGMNSPESNQAWFLKLRNESIDYIRTTQDDLHAHFNSWGSLHQIFIYIYGNTDRHLKQIKKIKAHPSFPKS